MSDFRFRVEETSNLTNTRKTVKKRGFEMRRKSGLTLVARGTSGAKAPPLAARPTLTPVIGGHLGVGPELEFVHEREIGRYWGPLLGSQAREFFPPEISAPPPYMG